MTRSQILGYISHIDGWLSLHEGYFLYESARRLLGEEKNKPHPDPLLKGEGKQGKNYIGEIVEIGSWKGKSTICLSAGSMSVGGEKISAVDPHKGEFSGQNGKGKKSPTFRTFLENLSSAGVEKYVVPLIATSRNAARSWKKPIKLLFIDGLHDYAHAKEDYVLWSPFVVNDGFVAFHDAFCGHEGPRRVLIESILFTNTY
ncbi:MAG TPA: class I SAM-dependent methyltransferase, partial [Candidatus Eisenbacteria bacterium]|nr:class I SAM-dependent methyltransferase [Candidatus Eisenbacteria bacterium]